MGSLAHPQPTNCWDGFVDKLNQKYGLGLQVPDLRLSPQKRREALKTEDDARSEHIHRLIRQITTHCPDVVPAIELQFSQEARAIYCNWVRKPRAAADLLPVTDTLPSASNAAERRELRECLFDVLKTHYADRGEGTSVRSRPNKQHPKRLSSDVPSEPRGGPTPSNGSPQKKAKAMLDQGSFRTTSNPPYRPSGRGAIGPNRLSGFKDSLAAAHPPPNHSFSEQPQHAPSTHSSRSWARLPSPRPSRGALTTRTHSFGHTLNQESANTSMATCHSKTFSCAYDSDSSQSTVPYDDREEYKDVSAPVDVSFYRPQTATGQGDIGSAARLNEVPTSGFTSTPFTSSEEHAMIALDPTNTEDNSGLLREMSEDPDPPDVLLTGPDQNAGSVYAEATMPIRQRGPVSSALSSIPATESTHWSADFDDRLPAYGVLPISDKPSIRHDTLTLEDRLRDSWPKLPGFLVNAPLAVVWEVTRAALHCGVRLEDLRMQYDDSWRDLTQFRRALATHPEFRGKTLPGKCEDDAWKTAFSSFRGRGLSVTLVIEASYTYERAGPLYRLSLQPLKLEKSHRLARRFGADRFLEVIIPSPTGGRDNPKWLKTDDLIALLAQSDHILLGRLWRSFYTKDDNKVEKRDVGIRTETNTIRQERLSLFAVDGNDFVHPITNTIPTKEDATDISRRVKMEIDDLLEWAISLSRNTDQPMLKLFSRLALSLSRTVPAVVLEKNQIIEHGCDLTSPSGKVMNDGIGRMSPSLAKAITKRIGIDDQEMPSGFQGRLGPYKGFWVIDTFDDGEIWIEGYLSQRKWNCDFDDADHRTFEVREWSRRLIPGALNEQFIPVLVNRAVGNSSHMKEAIRLLLEETVSRDLEELTHAAEDPVALHSWAHQNSSASRGEKINRRQVPFIGGLPQSDEDRLKFLLDAGFNSTLGFIQDLVKRLVKQKFELKDKLKITVPQSTYAFMTVDFSGVLEEGEVHLAFSRSSGCETRAPDGISRNELHGHDVLVARAPAHFPSDVQRVRAVFRPELRHLQDVIVFSRKGNVPLADLLSGGDYDGDKAWVCWHPNIVNNFQNAPVPEKRDLFKSVDGHTEGYLTKDKRVFNDLLTGCSNDSRAAISKFLRDSFAFNMKHQLLGICTSYKEKVCYRTGSVDDEKAIVLSTLVSHLVDQAKQGIVFTDDEFRRLRCDLIKMYFGPEDEPAYKGERYAGSWPPTHVLDWLKFKIAKPLIDDGLKTFLEAISGGSKATYRDPDLEHYFQDLEMMADDSKSYSEVRDTLRKDIQEVLDGWMKDASAPFQARVEAAYKKWSAIRPSKAALEKNSVKTKLVGLRDDPDSISYWGKLKASVTYHMAHYRSPGFVWWMAGAHLATIKAEMQSCNTGRPAFAVVPGMYFMHRPDRKIVKALQAKDEEVESVSWFWSDDEEADDA